jgi:hypothetical protein
MIRESKSTRERTKRHQPEDLFVFT